MAGSARATTPQRRAAGRRCGGSGSDPQLLYVANAGNSTITAYDEQGNPQTLPGGFPGLFQPSGSRTIPIISFCTRVTVSTAAATPLTRMIRAETSRRSRRSAFPNIEIRLASPMIRATLSSTSRTRTTLARAAASRYTMRAVTRRRSPALFSGRTNRVASRTIRIMDSSTLRITVAAAKRSSTYTIRTGPCRQPRVLGRGSSRTDPAGSFTTRAMALSISRKVTSKPFQRSMRTAIRRRSPAPGQDRLACTHGV